MNVSKLTKVICGLFATAAVWSQSQTAMAQINPGPHNTITGTYSSVTAGDYNVVNANYSLIGSGTNNTIPNGSDFNVLGGGEGNYMGGGASFMGGGYENIMNGTASGLDSGFENEQDGDYAFLGGGQQVTNTDQGVLSSIGGGYINYNNGAFGTIAGGALNTNQAANGGTIGGGSGNLIYGGYSVIPGGTGAETTLWGQLSHASGVFARQGDAQTSEYVLRNVTTNTNATSLFLNGLSAYVVVPTNSTWAFDITVAVRGTNAASGGFRTNGVIKDLNGTLTLLNGPISVPAIASDDATWAVTLSADNVNRALSVKVNGNSSTNHWVGTLRTTEIVY